MLILQSLQPAAGAVELGAGDADLAFALMLLPSMGVFCCLAFLNHPSKSAPISGNFAARAFFLLAHDRRSGISPECRPFS
ncbi:hypothetical protein DPMN_116315 [Dreissena polymorpha]|uniref:Uncharacterized protein n=1 Tax=Dreissena polymorpha TaxID=45954 RepID=A0A9D4KND0_DREPO|nr:hypothetical protein DPMN_116315 [Dreissena polymorpha]